MEITLAKSAGFCYGVRRAVDMARQAAQKGQVYTTGELIHNQTVIRQLEGEGILAAPSIECIPEGATVVIRAHGLPEDQLRQLEEKGCRICDATCPNVAAIHKIVQRESAAGRFLLIIGKAKHPEVLGIASRAGTCRVVETEEALRDFVGNLPDMPISVVCQTTFGKEIFDSFVNFLKSTCAEVQVFDTICKATSLRQAEARLGAEGSDAVIVIGDKQSSNSRELFNVCAARCRRTFFTDSAEALSREDFENCHRLFITAGASTPDPIIKEVLAIMSEEIKNTGAESFEELLEQSLKTLHTGEKVTGIVTKINATDVSVDLGVKQAGYIPFVELSDDPNYDVAANIKVGDEVEAFVVRVNDVEGVVMLSKKRLDAVKNWEKLEALVESKEIVTGTIVEQNKGGVVATVMGIRVFIPASQTGLPRGAEFETLLKTEQKLRVTEINRQRRRVVGSIREAASEARREASQKVWETIAVGNVYQGIVKSFTSYGAFVDIGGVDGMVHISELSWNHIKHPSEVLTIGQEVEVNVIGLDTEKKKISLGYRKDSENPWNKFLDTYNVGDVANVKIVKFMPFGAFAQILPGVDGLIHISQIADRRIGKPDEVLNLDEMVDAKITEIDTEKKKVSLSIRALLAPAAEETEEN